MQLLGTVDAGVRAASWSPDQEVLVLVTGSHTAMAMSTDMEVLHEVRRARGRGGGADGGTREAGHGFNPASSGIEQGFLGEVLLVGGWQVPLTGQGVVGEEEGSSTAVAWRGDGKYLAISCVEEEEGGKAARRVRRGCMPRPLISHTAVPRHGRIELHLPLPSILLSIRCADMSLWLPPSPTLTPIALPGPRVRA